MTQRLAPILALLSGLALTGCATGTSLRQAASSPAIARSSGSVHGGQQAVGGATIQLYQVSTSGYFTSATPMLSQAVVSNSFGVFSLPATYTCAAGTQVYLTAMGGNPGLAAAGANNAALGLMAGIGSCSYLLQNRASLYFTVNEVTTVAAAWSLSRFMSSPTNAGTSSTNTAGLANAFANIANVVNLASGTAPGTTLPAGATLPVNEINTLADILATCVNSDGNTQPGSPCTLLFAAATPPSGTVPSDTITAALDIAGNPTSNVASLYNLAAPTAPFQPTLASAPNNWLIGIHFTGGGLAQPAALAVDASGNIWTANPGNNSVSQFSPAGAPLSPSTGFTDASLASPSAIAIDASGNAWTTNATGSSVTGFTPSGTLFGALATNLSHPSGIAFDGPGNAWVVSPGTSTLVEFSPSQTFLQQLPTSATATAIAINPN